MKIGPARIEAFLRKPDPTVVAVLLYGPDEGLVRERGERLVKAVAGDPADPFRVADLTLEVVKEDLARLADEAAALPFTGGRRVVRVRDGKDAMTPAVSNLLAGIGGGGGLVVVEAGELTPRSTLRQTFERATSAAAISCYPDNGEGLQRVIADELGRHGLTATHEASDLLAASLGADRGLTRSEMEKLALFKGAAGRVDVEDVLAVVSDASAINLDAVVVAACDGDLETLARGLYAATGEGVSAIALLRAMARYLQRLLQAGAVVAAGGDLGQAVAAVRPPVFFRLQSQFRRQVRAWHPDLLAKALLLVAEAELACKQTGAPQDLLCHRAFFRLSEIIRAAAQRHPD